MRYNCRYAGDRRYISLHSWLTTGNMINRDFAYDLLPHELDPFDEETFEQSKAAFYATITNMRTGQAEYVRITNTWQQMDVIRIYPHAYVGDNVRIGDNTILYSGVKIYYNCVVGQDCILHAGVVVGSDGFGFEPDAKGVNQKLPQIGNVVIEDDVEIGANTTVDRAMMGSTVIRRNAKIDNLVQVAHNVEVGESTFLCSQVGIAGSTKIGGHCILAGQVGVAGHIEVADNCVFGAQTGVAGSVRKAGMYQGSPAIDAMNWRRSSVGFKQLPDIMKRLQELEKK